MSIQAVQPLYKRIESRHDCSEDQFKALTAAAGSKVGKEEYLAIRAVADSIVSGRYNAGDDLALEALAKGWIAAHPGPAVYFGNGVMNLAMNPGRLMGAQLKGGLIGTAVGVPVGAAAGVVVGATTTWGMAAAGAEAGAVAFSWTGPGAIIGGLVGAGIGAGIGWFVGTKVATVHEMMVDPNDPDNE